eukprot:PhM_4_TR11655/c0_g1_i1/m.16476
MHRDMTIARQQLSGSDAEAKIVTRLHLLFTAIDDSNTGAVTWDKFTTFLIDTQTMQRDECFVSLYEKVGQQDLARAWVHTNYNSNRQSVLSVAMGQGLVTVEMSALTASSKEILPQATFTVKHIVFMTEFLKDSDIIVAVTEVALDFFDLKSKFTSKCDFHALQDSPTSVRLHPNLNLLLVGCSLGTLCLVRPPAWNVRSRAWDPPVVVHRYKLHKKALMHICVLPGESQIAVVTETSMLLIVNLNRGTVIRSNNASNNIRHPTVLLYNDYSNFIALAGDSSDMLLYSITSSNTSGVKLRDVTNPHLCRVVAAVSRESSAEMFSVDSKGFVKIWDMSRLVCTQTLSCADSGAMFTGIFYDYVAKHVVAVSRRRLFRFGIEKAVHQKEHVGHLAIVGSAGIAFGVTLSAVLMWEQRSGLTAATYLNVCPGDVSAMCVIPPGTTVAIGTRVGSIYVFNLTTGRKVVEVLRASETEITDMVYCTSAQRVIATNLADELLYVNLNPQNLRASRASFEDPRDTSGTCVTTIVTQQRAVSYLIDDEEEAEAAGRRGNMKAPSLVAVGTTSHTIAWFMFKPPLSIRQVGSTELDAHFEDDDDDCRRSREDSFSMLRSSSMSSSVVGRVRSLSGVFSASMRSMMSMSSNNSNGNNNNADGSKKMASLELQVTCIEQICFGPTNAKIVAGDTMGCLHVVSALSSSGFNVVCSFRCPDPLLLRRREWRRQWHRLPTRLPDDHPRRIITCVAWSGKNEVLYVCFETGHIVVFDFDDILMGTASIPKILNVWHAHDDTISAITIDSALGVIYTSSHDITVKCWTYNGAAIASLLELRDGFNLGEFDRVLRRNEETDDDEVAYWSDENEEVGDESDGEMYDEIGSEVESEDGSKNPPALPLPATGADLMTSSTKLALRSQLEHLFIPHSSMAPTLLKKGGGGDETDTARRRRVTFQSFRSFSFVPSHDDDDDDGAASPPAWVVMWRNFADKLLRFADGDLGAVGLPNIGDDNDVAVDVADESLPSSVLPSDDENNDDVDVPEDIVLWRRSDIAAEDEKSKAAAGNIATRKNSTRRVYDIVNTVPLESVSKLSISNPPCAWQRMQFSDDPERGDALRRLRKRANWVNAEIEALIAPRRVVAKIKKRGQLRVPLLESPPHHQMQTSTASVPPQTQLAPPPTWRVYHRTNSGTNLSLSPPQRSISNVRGTGAQTSLR